MGYQRTREGDALALAAGHGEAAVADLTVESAVHLRDHLLGARGVQRVQEGLVADLAVCTQEQVVAQ